MANEYLLIRSELVIKTMYLNVLSSICEMAAMVTLLY